MSKNGSEKDVDEIVGGELKARILLKYESAR